jgi:membrane protease YdiL (CAAX protease family)
MEQVEQKKYPQIKNAILLCLLLLGIQLVFGVLAVAVQSLFKLSDYSLFLGIIQGLTSIISFGIVLLIGFKKTKRTFNEVFKFNTVSPFLWISTTIFAIGLHIVLSELNNVLNLILPTSKMLTDVINTIAAEPILIVSIIVMGIIPAITEELFFRGLIFDGLNRNYSQRKAIIISSLLFGIIHLNPWQFLTAFIIGLFLAVICIHTKSIALCIYIHLLNNTLSTIALQFKDILPIQGYNVYNTASAGFQPWWFDVMGTILLAIGIFMLKKGVEKANIDTAG